jgi:2-polyprenyl-6-methoxyphenol hydroxylase-like FAD-dependent oxidoreductase
MPYLHTKLGEGDVTLLGDAAHAQLPSLGLGVSTALGDIEELIAQVQSCSKYVQ